MVDFAEYQPGTGISKKKNGAEMIPRRSWKLSGPA